MAGSCAFPFKNETTEDHAEGALPIGVVLFFVKWRKENRFAMYLKKNIALLYAVSFLQGMVFYSSVATLYRQQAGLGIFEITLIESICLVLCLALEFPWGVLADRIGYKRTFVFCCALYFVSKLVFWRAQNFSAFLLERILLAAAISGLSGVDASLLYLSCPEERSQQVFGQYNAFGTAGLLVSGALFTLFLQNDLRRAGMWTAGSYGAAALLSLFLTEVRPPHRNAGSFGPAFGETVRAVLCDRPLLMLLTAGALLAETHQTITVFLNQLQYLRCGMDARAIGTVYLAVTVVGLCGTFSASGSRLLGGDRFGQILFVAAACACLCLVLTRRAFLSVGAILLLRAAFSLFAPLQAKLQNRRVHTTERATELSVHALLTDSAAVFTNLLFGSLAERSLSAAMALGAVFCLAGLCLFRCFARFAGSPTERTRS